MAYNILVVDDSQTTRSILKKMLSMTGIPISEMLQAENGQEALNILDNNRVDLMLIDINMPVMDGVELVNRVSADSSFRTIPMVIISTEGSKTRIAEMKAKGVLAYLRKPCTPEAVKSVVEDILGAQMQDEYKGILAEVFSDILMRHAFMFAEETPTAEIPVNDTGHLHATVCFNGQPSGMHGISASTKFCTQLAENVLGVEPGDETTANDVSDALEELANIVCGHFLTTAFGEGSIFNLSPPSVSRVNNAKWKQLIDSQEAIGFIVDNDPVIVYVSFNAPEHQLPIR